MHTTNRKLLGLVGLAGAIALVAAFSLPVSTAAFGTSFIVCASFIISGTLPSAA